MSSPSLKHMYDTCVCSACCKVKRQYGGKLTYSTVESGVCARRVEKKKKKLSKSHPRASRLLISLYAPRRGIRFPPPWASSLSLSVCDTRWYPALCPPMCHVLCIVSLASFLRYCTLVDLQFFFTAVILSKMLYKYFLIM